MKFYVYSKVMRKEGGVSHLGQQKEESQFYIRKKVVIANGLCMETEQKWLKSCLKTCRQNCTWTSYPTICVCACHAM